MSDQAPNGPDSMTTRTLRRLRRRLAELTSTPESEINAGTRLDALIARSDRRRVWSGLIKEGFELPDLERPPAVVWCAFFLLALLFATSLKAWQAILSGVELALFTRRVTRPLAVHPPLGCETLREAAIRATPFSQPDYHAGLWPHEDIADKVRLIIAEACNIPVSSIQDDTNLVDLLD